MRLDIIVEEGIMSESTKVIASLKKASNYTKLAMHKDGPHSFKRGQGALIKVIYKFGDGTLSKDAAKKELGWRGCDVRSIAKKAAENGYLTIDDPRERFTMTLTDLGTAVVEKRLEAEGKAADAILAGLTDAEKDQLIELCDKISATAEEMGVDYAKIQKKHGKKCCKKHHHEGHEHCHHHPHHHDAPQYVFVFGERGCCHEHMHGHHHGHGRKRH